MTVADPTLPKGGKLAQHAAVLCAEIPFRTFLFKRYGLPAFTEIAAAEAVRHLCGHDVPTGTGGTRRVPLKSRALLDNDRQAGERWRGLYAEYREWKGARR